MKNSKAKSAAAKSTTISDAEMAAVLADSAWARLERTAANFSASNTILAEDCCQDCYADMTDGMHSVGRR